MDALLRPLRQAAKAVALGTTLSLSLLSPALLIAQSRPSAVVPTVVKKIVKPQIADPTTITTYGYNNQRTGVTMNESAFIAPGPGVTTNINQTTFGKLWTRVLDGSVYTQPLYVPAVSFPKLPDLVTNAPNSGVFNTVFVCTSHNSIYAFDGGGSAKIKNTASTLPIVRVQPLWKINFNFAAGGVGPADPEDVLSEDVTPEIGIVGTPVIDVQIDPVTGFRTGTLYAVVKTKEPSIQIGRALYVHRLHAIDISSGRERVELGSPAVVNSRVPGSGDGSTIDVNGNQVLDFDGRWENQISALTLVNAGAPNATIYVAWSSHSNITPINGTPFHGWVISYNATNLQQCSVFNTSPNGDSAGLNFPAGAGIWMGGSGPASDALGNIYVATGTGQFNADPVVFSGGTEYGNSVLKLALPKNMPGQVVDYFTPFNWNNLSDAGGDLGAGGVVILPDVGNVTTPNLMVAGGVEGKIYLINRDSMGGFTLGSDSIVEELPNAVGPIYGNPAFFQCPITGSPGITNMLYYQTTGDVLKAYRFVDGFIDPVPTSKSTHQFDFPGATTLVSSMPDGTNAIVWSLERMTVPSVIQDSAFNVPAVAPKAVLHAYCATDISKEIFSSIMAGARDNAADSVLFTPPTIANGRVYIGATNQLTAFGFLADNGITPKPTEADHFIVTGPNISGAGRPLVSAKTGYWYSVTAIGPDGNPIKLDSVIHLGYLDYSTGAIHTIGNLNFKDPVKGAQSNVLFNYAFQNSGTYEIHISDDDNHTTILPFNDLAPLSFPQDVIAVGAASTAGLDHFVVTAPATAKVGRTFLLTINAVTANLAPYANRLAGISVYATLPNATQGADAIAPGFGYDQNQPRAAFGKILSGVNVPTSKTTLVVTMHGLGKHVFIVAGGGATGTVSVEGTP